MTREGVVGYLLNGLNRSQVKAVIMVAYRAASIGFVAWALGLLVPFHLGEGFAYAGEIQQIKEDVQNGRQDVLAGRLEFLRARAFDLRMLQCTAIAEKKSPQVYTVQLQSVLQDYKELSKDFLALPTCQELT